MKISLNTCVLDERIGIEKTLALFAEAGFDAADYTFSEYHKPDGPWQTQDKDAYARHLLQTASDCALVFNQAHAPFRYNWEDPNVVEGSIIPAVRDCLRACSLMRIDKMVVHGLSHPPVREPQSVRMEANVRFFNQLKPFAKEYGVKIALENLRYVCTTPDEYIQLMDMLNDDCFVACVDIGHAAVAGNIGEMIRRLGHERVQLLHIHDNLLEADQHMIPGTGKINWNKVLQALREIRYEGDFTLELLDHVNGLWKKENGFDVDFALSALKMAYTCGIYLAQKFL